MTLMTPADHRRGWLLALEHEHNDPQRGVLRASETISDARTDARAQAQKLRAQLALHDLDRRAEAILNERQTSPPTPDTTPDD